MSIRRPTLKSRIFMFRQFFQDRRIASVKATSPYLVRRICARLGLERLKVVVELGPGLGCFTRVLLDRLPQDGRLILFESNEEFITRLRSHGDPRMLVIPGVALRIPEILTELGVDGVDAVVSGIPFSHYPEAMKMALLRDIHGVLNDPGIFVAYQSTTQLERPLRRVFPSVRVEREPFHIPPLAILEARTV